MNIYCPHLFRDSVLHLVLWARFDEPTHTAGLQLVRSLLDSHDLDGEIMLLLRPVWRTTGPPDWALDPLCFQAKFLEPDTPFDAEWCELWLQVSAASAHEVAETIRAWRKGRSDARAHVRWQGDGGALWGPLSRGLQDCQYAGTRSGGAQRFLAGIPTEQIAWFLKLIWHRSTLVIANHCLGGALPVVLDPRGDQGRISDLAGDLLADITAGTHGIAVPSDPSDPSEYVASHLAAFAINAVTKVLRLPQRTVYQLEQYYPGLTARATRPYQFGSRTDYLRELREAEAHV